MKVVWTPNTIPTPPKSSFKNVWYRPTTDVVWMDPQPYPTLEAALLDREEQNYKRIAVLEFPN